MEIPKISVIIPATNAEKTLRQCLNSISNQTYNNYDVIVVDNNSTDKTKDIIEEFCNKDNRIRYLFEPKIGRGAARYKGEINSSGEIILMTDSDCIVPNNWIEEMIEPIIKNKALAVQGIKKASIINYWTKHIQEEGKRLTMERIKDKKIGLLDTANFAIKKSILQEIGYTNPDIANLNDAELDVRLKIRGHHIYFKQIDVLHYHTDTVLKVFKKQFNRGEWNGRIRKIYKDYREIFPVTSKIEHLLYFIRIPIELLTFHENFMYDLITGIAWRIGLIYGWRKKLSKCKI